MSALNGLSGRKFISSFAAILIMAAVSVGYSMEISFLIGDVSYTSGGKTSPLTMSTALKPGDVVATGKKSLCTLKYRDGSNVEIRAESKIMVGNVNVPGSDYISLISGMVHGKFVKMQKGGGNKVYTPTAVCAIRGTEFTIASSGSGDSRIQLEEGKLQIRNPYGRVNINENENSDVNIAARPGTDRKSRKLESWMEDKGREFENDPGSAGDRYGSYMDRLGDNSKASSKKVSEYDKNLMRNSMRGKGAMEKANSEIDTLDEKIQDDMYLGNAARGALDGIIGGFDEAKADLRGKFIRVKEECDRVADQQRRNYEALRAVKEAYRKAYEEIVKKHRDSVENIKDSLMPR